MSLDTVIFATVNAAKRSLGTRRSARIGNSMLRIVTSRNYYPSTTHNNDPALLELEKLRNLSNLQDKRSTSLIDAPGWNESLASASEAAIKADRLSRHSDLAELQRNTVEHLQTRRMFDAAPNRNSSNEELERDVVSGPLSSRGQEEKITEEDTTVVTREEIHGPLRNAPSVKKKVVEDSHRVSVEEKF